MSGTVLNIFYVLSQNFLNNPMKLVILSSLFCGWRNWVTERLNNFPKVTQPLNVSFNKHTSYYWHLFHTTSRKHKIFQKDFMSNVCLWFILIGHCCLITTKFPWMEQINSLQLEKDLHSFQKGISGSWWI